MSNPLADDSDLDHLPKPTPRGLQAEVFYEQAKDAFGKKDFAAAATRAEQSLAALKSEGAPTDALLERKEYVARCQYKAKRYEAAYLNYKYLAKAKPQNKELSKTASLIKGEYWRKELKPELDDAENHLANARLGKARFAAQEIQGKLKTSGLDVTPAQNLLARIDRSEKHLMQKGSAKRREATLNRVIPVQIGPGIGNVTHMTRREYLRRKKLETGGRKHKLRKRRRKRRRSRRSASRRRKTQKSYPKARTSRRSSSSHSSRRY